MGYKLTGDQCREFSRKLAEIGRQIGQTEYPYDPQRALRALQDLVEGKFGVDEIIEHELLIGPDVVSRNVKDGRYEGYVNPNINDDNYPVSGEGIVKVRFKMIPGERFEGEKGYCCREDFQRYCCENGLREPNAAEATLPHTKDKQLGRRNCPTVAFIGGSRAAFIVNEHNHERNLDQNFGGDFWGPICVFLAVCE